MEEQLNVSENKIGFEEKNIIEEEEKLILPPVEQDNKKRPYERKYPLTFDMGMFELNDGRTLKELELARITANGELNRNRPMERDPEKRRKALEEQFKKDGNRSTPYWVSENRYLTFQEQVQRKAARFDAEAAILYRNKRLWREDKPAMKHVKRCMAALTNFLSSGDMNEMKKGNSLDPNLFLERVNTVYQAAIEACDDYLTHRNPSRWFGKGLARYQMVDRLKKRCLEEIGAYQNAKDALVQNAIIIASSKLKSPRDVLENIRSTEIVGDPVWQNQGNSTDVYRIVLKMADSGEMRTFYMKENLQLLSVDLPGFVGRRLNQLSESKKNRGSKKKEEARMRENRTDITDYQNGIDFFTRMKDSLDKASGRERFSMEKRYADFFGQDFDELFKEFHAYNDAINGNKQVSVDELIKTWERKLKDDPGDLLAKDILSNLRKIKEGKPPKTMTAAEWIKGRIRSGKMGLDMKKDSALIDALLKMQEKEGEALKENNAGRIETFFRITCGKEVELYGQMKARGQITDKDIAASNNSATAKLAEVTGFKDLICSSYSSMVNYKRRDGTKGPAFVTIIEEAEGEELVELQHKAMNEGKKLVLSSKAVMQLQELYCFDLACLQVDRHGRNFKCKFDESDKEIVIKSVKAYDNDMSFTEATLDTVFQTDDKKGTKKAGFLPPLFKTVKKNSLEYAHIAGNYFNTTVARQLNITNKAVIHTPNGDLELTDLEKNKILVTPMYFNAYFSNVGKVKVRRTGEILEDNKGYEYKDELSNLAQRLKALLYRDDNTVPDYQAEDWLLDKAIKKEPELTKEEKKELGRLIYKLQKLHEEIDITDVDTDPLFAYWIRKLKCFERIHNALTYENKGVLESWVESFLYFFSNAYGKNPDVLEGYEEEKNSSVKGLSELTIKEGEKKPGEEGDLYVPTMLHFSSRAYQNLLSMQRKLKEDDNLIGQLADMNITDEKNDQQERSKLEALRKRVDQEIAQLREAEKAAKVFYEAKGYTGVHAKFFLTDEEAEEIEDLGEFTWNAGETYLAIDNDEYLAGQTEFKNLMTEGEKQQWLNATNNRLTDQKRHKFHSVNTLDNPLSNKIHREAGK